MRNAETIGSPLSNEHYKALASVADRLAEIINTPNSCAYSRKECTDSLSKIVGILGALQITPPFIPT